MISGEIRKESGGAHGWTITADSSFGGGKPKNSFPNRMRPFKGLHDVILSWDNDAFCVTVPAMSSRMFESMLSAPWAQTAHTKGQRHGCQVRQDLVTKASA